MHTKINTFILFTLIAIDVHKHAYISPEVDHENNTKKEARKLKYANMGAPEINMKTCIEAH
jgi:hypothetical protein